MDCLKHIWTPFFHCKHYFANKTNKEQIVVFKSSNILAKSKDYHIDIYINHKAIYTLKFILFKNFFYKRRSFDH